MDNFNLQGDSLMGDIVSLEKAGKKKATKKFVDYGGVFIAVSIVFAVIFIVSNEISVTSAWDLASFGLDFFLLLFCTYAMYIGCADSGSKAGLMTQAYNATSKRFDDKKEKVIQSGYQKHLLEFCQDYIERELRSSRTTILSNVGVDYEEYCEKYAGKDKQTINALEGISKIQKKAINTANDVKPIRLTPEMIMMRGTSANRRSPLGTHPRTRKNKSFGGKFISSASITLVTTAIVLQTTSKPLSVIIATCAMKLVTIIVNGFLGYKMGYENIVVYTVDYMSNQTDLMEQAIRYCVEREGGADKKVDEKPHQDLVLDESRIDDNSGRGQFHEGTGADPAPAG